MRTALKVREKLGEETLVLNGTAYPVSITINRRAKRLILKTDPIAQKILLTCPTKKSVKEGLAFAQERELWLLHHLTASPPARPFEIGGTVPLLGDKLEIIHDPERTRSVIADYDSMGLFVGGSEAHLARRVEDWLKSEARKKFCAYADEFCKNLNLERGRISIRDSKTRWGSCSSNKSISLSWRLILAPAHVAKYVVAHEVSHIKHMDHSPAFWGVVASLMPDYKKSQAWLKAHGKDLYLYGKNPSA